MKKIDCFIVGLGNPGKEYEDTRHNVGFLGLEEIRLALAPAATWEENQKLETAWLETIIDEKRVLLIKPLGFMNHSGFTLKKWLLYRGFTVSEFIKNGLLIYDDADLFEGRLKMKDEGGSAGHKGVTNILAVFGTKKIARLKLGIRPQKSKIKARSFVLRRISKTSPLVDAIERLPSLVRYYLENGLAKTQTLVNQK